MKKNLLFLLGWFVIVNVFAVIVLNRVNVSADTAYTWIDGSKTQEQSWNLISLHSRWDSFFYQDIAENGYYIKAGEVLANVVFFPLYPLLVFIITPLLLGNIALAGWLVSMLALGGSVYVFSKLLKEFHPTINVETPIVYLLIFPTAFFLNAVYTESLFLLLSLSTFYFARKGRFGLAGLLGMLAALTRVTGLLLFIPVLYEFWKKNGTRKCFSLSILPLALIPSGTTAFFLYHYIAFGDFFLFLKIESAWGRAFAINADHLQLFSHPATVNLVMDIGFTLFALFATFVVFKQKWVSYGLYILASLGVALSTGTFMSIGRYVLVLFPVFIAVATIRNQTFERLYLLASVLLLALNITLFIHGHWAG